MKAYIFLILAFIEFVFLLVFLNIKIDEQKAIAKDNWDARCKWELKAQHLRDSLNACQNYSIHRELMEMEIKTTGRIHEVGQRCSVVISNQD